MARPGPSSRSPHSRPPLEDATHRANSIPPPRSAEHDDVKPLSPMTTQSRPSPRVSASRSHGVSRPASSPAAHKSASQIDNKRISEVVVQDDKRGSLFSTSSASGRKTYVGPWQLGKTIGRGGCSSVRMVRNKYTSKVCAAKIISKVVAEKARAMSLANLEKAAAARGSTTIASQKVMPFGLEREIVIMKLLDHPNIVHLYDVWENRNELYLVMEYVEGGELFDFIQANACIDEQTVVYIFRQIVAALLYCHRMSIFHRDLKPENILLDRNTYQIKLVDFGMAALQPEGRFLKTPCGSPHYAAPELLQYKPYEGTKVDTWSSGVILFVMLAGTPPFNYPSNSRDMTDNQRMHALYDTIIAADYRIPVGFTVEAEDLIRRIFVSDPNKRISLAEVWDHPLMHKYDAALGFRPDDLERSMGPPPSLEAWVPLNRHTIDRDLFRNLRTLWHDVNENELAGKLLSKELNIEKYFYLRLMESREEQLENYAGYPDGIAYSASDYHHLQPYPRSPFVPAVPQSQGPKPVRTKSQYSILNDEHLKSRLSLHSGNDPASDASYDPFRASREPVMHCQAAEMKVTVHRNNSTTSSSRSGRSRHRLPISSASNRNSLRVEALKRGARTHSTTSMTNSSVRSTPRRFRGPASQGNKRSYTRSSLGSSLPPSSPPVYPARHSNLAKPKVRFSHTRRSSTLSALTKTSTGLSVVAHIDIDGSSLDKSVVTSSPALPSNFVMRSKKEGQEPAVPPRLKIQKPANPQLIIEKEARKVSTELEAVCNQAFFRSSLSSSHDTTTGTSEKGATSSDTPPSYVPKSVDPLGTGGNTKFIEGTMFNRPLPPVPMATPRTFAKNEIRDTRDRLAARVGENGTELPYYNEVMDHLNYLVSRSGSTASKGSRATSAPNNFNKSTGDALKLPVIDEEERGENGEDEKFAQMRRRNRRGKRSATEPEGDGRTKPYYEHETIRLVEQSSPTPIAPLNIRKKSSEVCVLEDAATAGAQGAPRGVVHLLQRPLSRAGRSFSGQRGKSDKDEADQDVMTIKLPGVIQDENDLQVKKKKSFFWRKSSAESGKSSTGPAPDSAAQTDQHASPEWESTASASVRCGRQESGYYNTVDLRGFSSQATSGHFDFDQHQKETKTLKTGGFMSFFKRKKGDNSYLNTNQSCLELGSDLSVSTTAPSFELSTDDSPGGGLPKRPSEVNWFAKFFHLKPSTRILCFQIGRGRARTEVVRILRGAQQMGVKDLQFSREDNVISARIGRNNQLKIKPVSVACEIFAVLERGRRAQLCVARFTQTKGAASSFNHVVGIMETILSSKGLLVENEERAREMCEILA